MAANGIRSGLPLFSFRGIKVLVHWTFLLLPAWIIGSGLADGEPWSEVLARTGLVLIVFVCVVLHEFGHALTAQRYGIRTRDITLLPIGGVASLEHMPEDPRQEFWITVAGPLVNLVIAALSFVGIAIAGISLFFSDVLLGATTWTSVLMFVFTANLSLFLFNLLPAFPMDGGRILRSLLSMRIPRERATRIAAQVGRVFAVLFVVGGIYMGAPFMAIIGVFVYFAAGAEARSVQQKALLETITVQQVMRTRFWSMSATSRVQEAVDELLAGGDETMVVLDGSELRGILTREDLLAAVAQGKAEQHLAGLPLRQVIPLAPEAPAHQSYQRMMLEGQPILPVVAQGRVIGIFEPDNLAEFLQLMQARGQRR